MSIWEGGQHLQKVQFKWTFTLLVEFLRQAHNRSSWGRKFWNLGQTWNNWDQLEKDRKIEEFIALASREFAYKVFQEIDSSKLSIGAMDTPDGLLNLKSVSSIHIQKCFTRISCATWLIEIQTSKNQLKKVNPIMSLKVSIFAQGCKGSRNLQKKTTYPSIWSTWN